LENADKSVKQFNALFTGVDRVLAEIERKYSITHSQLDRLDHRYSNAESIATERELLKINHPDEIMKESAAGTGLGELARFGIALAGAMAGEPVSAAAANASLGRVIDRQSQATARYIRGMAQHEVREASLKKRAARYNLDELEADLQRLDEEFKKLGNDKDFLKFLESSEDVEHIRNMYMIMPRLVSGENNIEALELRMEKAGFASLDDFVADLRTGNERLADAMENWLLGIANSNDLKVLVVEANGIDAPASPKEALLVACVEDIIKPNYHDYARQASMMDYLEMRNVVATNTPFYSIGEVVKKQTDKALQALLSGEGEMSLVGSNDVHRMFGYYMSRHGDKSLSDPRGRRTNVLKIVDAGQSQTREEIADKSSDIVREKPRNAEIPRIGSLFTEVCAYEYLLTQGHNIADQPRIADHPHVLGALDMVNSVTEEFIKRLALQTARGPKRALGLQIENLIAQSFIDFFSVLGAAHGSDPKIKASADKVTRAYRGENFGVANSNYTLVITNNATSQQAFGLFLNVYQHNLEKYLESATRPNRKALLEQLSAVADIMQDLQPGNIMTPESPEARMQAHYRSHMLGNAGVDRHSWVLRSESIRPDGRSVD
jgi:hypothetical protein